MKESSPAPPSLPYARVAAEGVYLTLKVQPRASRNEIGEVLGNLLRVRVTAPPVDAAANEAVLRLLAEVLDCPRGALQLVRGHTARQKVILARGLPLATIQKRMAGAVLSQPGGPTPACG